MLSSIASLRKPTQSNQVLAEVLRNVDESKGCIDGLDKLVVSGVINKLQADIINKKIQIAMIRLMENKVPVNPSTILLWHNY